MHPAEPRALVYAIDQLRTRLYELSADDLTIGSTDVREELADLAQQLGEINADLAARLL